MPDMSAYKEAFISEARDHLDTLNEGLLVLEKSSDDKENINKLFRAFHTLKGNSATMGFIKFSELAHSLEDLLSKIRDGELKVDQQTIDLLLEGLDILEGGLELIDNDEADSIEIEDCVKKLKERMGQKDEVIKLDIPAKLELDESQKKLLAKEQKSKNSIFRIILFFERKNFLKAAKSSLVLRNLSDSGNFIKTTPVMDEIKMGKFDQEVEFVFSAKISKEETEKIINKVSGIKHVFILGLEEEYKRPEQSNEEKEKEKANIAQKHQQEVVKQIQSVKVNMTRLDKLMNLVGELLISNIRLQDINKRHDIGDLRSVLTGVDRLILDLQDEVMQIRMVPIGNIFNRFPRMVRDLANKENKKLELVIEGAEIEFDRTVLDEIGDPLVHLLRNAVDHGIEIPEERAKTGKPEQGTIKLIARREKNNAVIEIQDDGGGIDPQRVKAAAIKKETISKEEAEKMNENQLQMLIFRPGTSTNEVVTEVSGRGVGMDVVLSKVKELGGNVKLNSGVGKGTTVTLELPLTIAIITSLIVRVGNDRYTIPLASVDETIHIRKSEIKTIQNYEVFLLRKNDLPLFWLHSLTGISEYEKPENLTVVVVSKGNEKIGLVVDEILSQQQVLIKTLQEMVKGTKGCAGATILGDGSVALILDIGTLID